MIDWDKKLQVPGVRLVVFTRTAHGVVERMASVLDVQKILLPSGLEVTTRDAVDWSDSYPGKAEHITRICLLQQRVSDLRHRLRQRSRLRLVRAQTPEEA